MSGYVTNKNESNGQGSASFTLWMMVAGLVVVLDQVTKWAIIKWVELHQIGLEVTTWFRITHR